MFKQVYESIDVAKQVYESIGVAKKARVDLFLL
jgi:hypothetical protein